MAATIINRSLSQGNGHGASVSSGKKAKSNPQFKTGFEGLNLYQQRYARGGNQFTVEPPDQGLCVGNGYVVEAVNDVLNVFNTSGSFGAAGQHGHQHRRRASRRNVNHAVDLNSFYGYAPAINRTTGVRGAVRDRPELPVRRGDAALLRRRPDPRDGPDDGRVHAREPPRHRGQPDREPDRHVEHLPARRHERRDQHRRRRTPARTSATIRTSAPTPTASTSRPTPTRGAATASRARRSTRSRRRSSRRAQPT